MRALDAALAGLCVWGSVSSLVGFGSREQAGALVLVVLGLGLVIRSVRVRWRPVTGFVGLRVSRSLRPGDHAWYVRPGDADVVLVTARRGVRLVIARPDLVSGEGMSVRRTRVLLLPVEAERGRQGGYGRRGDG